MNTCPLRRSGGLSYGATYSGPIGLIIDPTFNARKIQQFRLLSSLNGSCTNVCPVKINIHEQILCLAARAGEGMRCHSRKRRR
jgi:L-lactate dehydrogenase complex protein LldF